MTDSTHKQDSETQGAEGGKKVKACKNVAALSARLSAVQATYQVTFNKRPISDVAREYADLRMEMEIDGETLVKPDAAKFKQVLLGVDERMADLQGIIQASSRSKDGEAKAAFEPLLQSVLLCGAYELLACQDIDSPIIINDYINVTHSFYGQGEASLVNAVLDKISKVVRENAAL